MTPLSLRCVRAAFVFFAAGIALGLVFAFDRSLGLSLRPLHAELNLWGWVTLLTYGFAYHMLPQFAGRDIRWPRLGHVQSWAAISGVATVAAGWMLRTRSEVIGDALAALGGIIQLAAAVAFVVLIGELLTGRRWGQS